MRSPNILESPKTLPGEGWEGLLCRENGSILAGSSTGQETGPSLVGSCELGGWVYRFDWRLSLLQPNSSSFHHMWLYSGYTSDNTGDIIRAIPVSGKPQAQPPPSHGNQIAPILTETRTAQNYGCGGKTRVHSGYVWGQIALPGFKSRQKARGESTLSRRNTNQETNLQISPCVQKKKAGQETQENGREPSKGLICHKI